MIEAAGAAYACFGCERSVFRNLFGSFGYVVPYYFLGLFGDSVGSEYDYAAFAVGRGAISGAYCGF